MDGRGQDEVKVEWWYTDGCLQKKRETRLKSSKLPTFAIRVVVVRGRAGGAAGMAGQYLEITTSYASSVIHALAGPCRVGEVSIGEMGETGGGSGLSASVTWGAGWPQV